MVTVSKVVLVVEDEPANRRLFRDLLTRNGYTVVMAASGGEAVGCALEQKPDLILMDIGLPGMSGLDATRTIRQNGATATIPIVALSAFALKEDRERALQAGCDAFVAKPFDIADLLKVVRDHIQNGPAGVAARTTPEEGRQP